MRAAGVDREGRPLLAICRAHEERCQLRMFHGGGAVYVGGTTRWVRANSRKQVFVPEGTFPRRDSTLDATALVPLIPPRFRPPSALAGYHLLWEAEWLKAVPVDPMLLKHLGGAIYAVLAQWDLTPLERAVLAGRL